MQSLKSTNIYCWKRYGKRGIQKNLMETNFPLPCKFKNIFSKLSNANTEILSHLHKEIFTKIFTVTLTIIKNKEEERKKKRREEGNDEVRGMKGMGKEEKKHLNVHQQKMDKLFLSQTMDKHTTLYIAVKMPWAHMYQNR